MKDPQRHKLYMIETIFWAEWNEHAAGMYDVMTQQEWEEYSEFVFADGLKNPYYAQRRRTRTRPLRFVELPETYKFLASAYPSTDTLGVKPSQRKKYLAMHEVCHLLTREMTLNSHGWQFVSVYSQMIGRHVSEAAAIQFRGLAHSQSIQFTQHVSDVRIVA
jgi:hypothetical protein